MILQLPFLKDIIGKLRVSFESLYYLLSWGFTSQSSWNTPPHHISAAVQIISKFLFSAGPESVCRIVEELFEDTKSGFQPVAEASWKYEKKSTTSQKMIKIANGSGKLIIFKVKGLVSAPSKNIAKATNKQMWLSSSMQATDNRKPFQKRVDGSVRTMICQFSNSVYVTWGSRKCMVIMFTYNDFYIQRS